jgi:hypothetical protein
MISHACPVCGFALSFAPWQDGVPADEICPSCGIQFGYDDAAGGDPEKRRTTYVAWRERWTARGMPWTSKGQSPPPGWNPLLQLELLRRDV